ncbi:MAG: AAA family ATPase [Proteobacteria bacterium]|jgi:exodeoxyribonuclease V alpha subunit|nr:AAA family ATPase [Rhodospirillales bacterium]MBT4987235.1 AAA family ATPase [Pseudomonadota bacterium]MBT6200732.1 AAA family ATPase [Bacteroidetes Order II. bacterium]
MVNKKRQSAAKSAVVVVCIDGKSRAIYGASNSSGEIFLGDGWHFLKASEVLDKKSTAPIKSINFPASPLKGLKSYFGTYAFKGVGTQTADKLLSGAKSDVFAHLSETPDKLVEHCGISLKAAIAFAEAWAATEKTRNLQVLLREIGFGNAGCRDVIDQYGEEIIDKLLTDPYGLVEEIRYFSFDDAAKAIKAMGLKQTREQKLVAAIKEALRRTERERGHTCMPLKRLFDGVQRISEYSPDDVEEFLSGDQSIFEKFEYRNAVVVASREAWEREKKIITFLKKLGSASPGKGQKLDFSDRSTEGHALTKQQTAGVEMAVGHRLALITGGPGTGKSTLVATLVRELIDKRREVLLCAPTGRAARRLEAAPDLKAVKPSTIHRMLSQRSGNKTQKVDALIIDEASMIDLDLMARVIDVLDEEKSTLIMIGDADQLPPVGSGQLFCDLLKNPGIKSLRLTENFRQSDGSGIIDAAGSVIAGRTPDLTHIVKENGFTFIERADDQEILATVLDLYMKELPVTFGVERERDIQILCPQRTGMVGTNNLNEKIQGTLRSGRKAIYSEKKSHSFFVGDKVINTTNNYELSVMNGDIGHVLRGKDDVFVAFDGEEKKFDSKAVKSLELAYAISIHKSQGSEYPVVIIPVSNAHAHMLGRNLIYTAITRAKMAAIVIGSKETFEAGIRAAWKDFRYTISPTLLSSSD